MKIFNEDCIPAIKAMKENQFDICITSPPYNMNLRIMNGKYKSRQIVRELSTKYMGYDDNLPMDDYFEFLRGVVAELVRVCGLVFFNVQIVTGNKPSIFRLLGEYHDQVKELIVWDKTNAEPSISDGCLNSEFELLIVFSSKALTRAFSPAYFERGTLSNIFRIKKGRSSDPTHGASFPVQLPSKILSNFGKRGDSVLDPFAGTGTTGIACHDFGFDFTGYEINPEYFKTMQGRIKRHSDQMRLL